MTIILEHFHQSKTEIPKPLVANPSNSPQLYATTNLLSTS